MNLTGGRKNAWTEMDRAGQQEIPAGGANAYRRTVADRLG